LKALVVTAGEQGVTCHQAGRQFHIPSPKVENIVDICGAGDSFSAGAVGALACGAPLDVALHFGSLVASVTITKRGTGTAHPEEIRAAARRYGLLV
jgi:sugar/nucleoside kinase (ribokinase family)